MIEANDQAPDFTLAGPDGPLTLAYALAAGPVILLFFQEADTPTCEAQLRGFAADHDLVRELGARVLAISTDPPETQARFAATLAAPFTLLSDLDGAVARAYGVLDEASGRSQRAAFVIRADGTVALAIPWYNPRNASQFEQVFLALG